MILSAASMRALEESAFARGISAEELMEEAGRRSAAAVLELFPAKGHLLVVFGKGNNGGDALVAARHLGRQGWGLHLIPAFAAPEWGPLCRQKFERVQAGRAYAPGVKGFHEAFRRVSRETKPLLVLDGLLGLGARGALRAPLAEMVEAIEALHERGRLEVCAVDLPTGLEADSGEPATPCLHADVTLCLGAIKQGTVADAATAYVGRLAEIALPQLQPGAEEAPAASGCAAEVAGPARLGPRFPRRSWSAHKGDCGRVGIVAGSAGYLGAARLCAEACVRGGAGLVTLYVPEEIYPALATACLPEVMVKGVSSYKPILDLRHDVLALGPGLGRSRAAEILALIHHAQVPTIIDADALNILSEQMKLLYVGEAPRLLTPHPKEMERLDPASGQVPRAEAARQFVERYPVTLLLKGARTVVAQAERPLSYNSTGHPGMATGGMGDVLTGVCAALAGQKLELFDVGRVGAWVCGRAAELAVAHGGESAESLTPTALMAQLGPAFQTLHRGGY